ncbi:MAG: nicotinate-nucleotide--dimethylbenzimidazole phosphoribosyltransferase, partial [Hominilimicola sp.]
GYLADRGYKIIVTGEMGIGNTTTSSAVASVLLDKDVEKVTGRGAGLSKEGLERKIEVIKQSIALHKPDKNDVIDVISKVGGYDIAALAGAFIGGAVYGVPIVIDGFISAVAALCAYRLCKESRDFMIASHVSKESAAEEILKILGKKAPIDAMMCLGEGTGGVMLLAALDTAVCVYNEMSTFEDINVESYKELK